MELTPRTLAPESDADESPDAIDPDPDSASSSGGGPDLAPKPPRARGPGRRWLPLLLVGVVVVAMGALVMKGLDEATTYFLNADEAVAQREDLGDRRFRLQGTVVDQGVATADGVTFDVEYDGVTVEVHHVGTPPDMFEPGIPVVLEGRWDVSGEYFASDEMLVKHDESYVSREDYEERMDDAEDGESRDESDPDGATTP